jgi:UDP-N-acetylmuramate--alanine ligase
MSAIARVLLERGWSVTGSDLHMSDVAQSLVESGAEIAIGHDAANVGQVDAVLVSSAIPADNPELVAARCRGIPILKRAEFLGRLMQDKIGIAVAGTAGKTTTTSMLVWILTQAGRDPSYIVGGVIDELGTNAHAGEGAHFVIEADEYDYMFLGLRPAVAAVTHLEHDHPDCYPTFAEMKEAFAQFVDRVPGDGLIVGATDHPHVAALLAECDAARIWRCGLGAGSDWRADGLQVDRQGGYAFQVYRDDAPWGAIRLGVPGAYNVQNALVAMAIASWLGVDKADIQRSIATFSGIARRFQILGRSGEIVVIDDYAHHPTKIRAALAAAKARYRDRPLWAVFQPHTYSRTKALWEAFCSSFAKADHVLVLDVYPARETDTLGVDVQELAQAIEHTDVRYTATTEQAVACLLAEAERDAVIMTLSAGDGNEVGIRLLDRLAAVRDR